MERFLNPRETRNSNHINVSTTNVNITHKISFPLYDIKQLNIIKQRFIKQEEAAFFVVINIYKM